MTTRPMKKVPPSLLQLTEYDHLPPRRLRVQVVTNSKGYLELNLSGRELRIIPAETFQLTGTQVLRLAHNYIDYLPMMIAYLRGLRVLDLQHNLVVHLPETLVNCRHLAELQLTANRLTELPKSIGGLKNLRVLALGENQFEQLPPEVGQMSSLRTLDLHGNKLWHLPFSLQELKHLLQLNVSDNMFDHIPLVITKITSLQALNLSRNRLSALPLDFDALKGLRELNMSHNKFASISSMLVTLKHLKYLSLASNGLKFLPSQMSQLQNLRVLHLQDNNLRHVPCLLRKLRYYNISKNQLTSFSVEGMRSLVSLTASLNKLETTPRGLYKLRQLKFLYLDNNRLVEIEEDIGILHQLRVLDLSNNELITLPQSLYRLTKLHSFNVKGNHKLARTGFGRGGRDKSKLDKANYELKRQNAKSGKMEEEIGLYEREHLENGDKPQKTQDLNVKTVGKKKAKTDKAYDVSYKHHTYVSDNGRRKPQEMNGHIQSPVNNIMNGAISASEWELRSSKFEAKQTEKPRFFKGRGVTLPSSKSALNLRQMPFASNPTRPVKSETKKPRKSHSVRSLKDILFGKSKKAKSVRSDGKIWDPHATMRTANSLQFPIHYDIDDVNEGRRDPKHSDVFHHSVRTRSSTKSGPPYGKPYKTDIDDLSDMMEERQQRLSQTQIKSIYDGRKGEDGVESDSHGYGTWQSRNRPHYHDDYFDEGDQRPYQDRYNSDYRSDTHRNRRPRDHEKPGYNGPHSSMHNQRPVRRSFSSEATTSDIIYIPNHRRSHQAYSGNPRPYNFQNAHDDFGARYPSRQSQYYKSRDTGRWYNPDDESSLTISENTAINPDYSIREARASFATETASRDLHYHHKRPFSHGGRSRYSPEFSQTRPRSLPASALPSRDHSVREAYASFAIENTLPHRVNEKLFQQKPRKYQPYFKEYDGEGPQQSQRAAKSEYPINKSQNDGRWSMRSFRSYKSDSILDSDVHDHRRMRRHGSQTNPSIQRNLYASRERLFDSADSDDAGQLFNDHHNTQYRDDEPRHFRDWGYADNGRFRTAETPEYHPHQQRSQSLPRPKPIRKSSSSRFSYISDYVDYNDSPYNQFNTDSEDNDITSNTKDEFSEHPQPSFSHFDHVLSTKDIQVNKPEHSKSWTSIRDAQLPNSKHFDENFTMKKKPGAPLAHSRSMDSLMDKPSAFVPYHQSASQKLSQNKRSSPASDIVMKAGNNAKFPQAKANNLIGGTDYSLLGVCNQIETLLNKDLLQPVIGFSDTGSHRFSEKTIREKAQGLWRLGSHARHEVNDASVNSDNDSDENDDDDPDDIQGPGLEYSQPQSFNVTSTGGQFESTKGPKVMVNVPAHAINKSLQVTIQLLFIHPWLISKVRELNHFVNNIIAVGPIVYFHTTTKDISFNSPATITIPAPAALKGGHLVILTIRGDNSCIPCSSGYRSGRLTATLSAWHFTAKVALITRAKCKYKACKSMEQLLQCTGATQI